MFKAGEVRKSFLQEIAKAKNPQDLEAVRIKHLGRKSELAHAFGALKDLPLEKRRVLGPELQTLKREIEEIIDKKSTVLATSVRRDVDITAPGRKIERGHLHPLTQVDREIRRIFSAMNFSVVDGPEIENEYYNFDALNIPPNHPARDAWDTFWLQSSQKVANRKSQIANRGASRSALRDRLLLRTHTSPVQIRYMEEHSPPFQIIVPGRVFRYEATDASHEINFYQLEGLMVGKNITLANFKFVVEVFLKKFFAGQKIEFRYRPSYFPFVEPGLEVDIKIANSKNDQRLALDAKRTGWLEVMGAGMVHPRVFEYAHYNPRSWQGFAFGIGIDRLAMIKYKIPDIRMFYGGDLRFIRQF